MSKDYQTNHEVRSNLVERMRGSGVSKEQARKLAEDATRRADEKKQKTG